MLGVELEVGGLGRARTSTLLRLRVRSTRRERLRRTTLGSSPVLAMTRFFSPAMPTIGAIRGCVSTVGLGRPRLLRGWS
jgi:hypothetical protein